MRWSGLEFVNINAPRGWMLHFRLPNLDAGITLSLCGEGIHALMNLHKGYWQYASLDIPTQLPDSS